MNKKTFLLALALFLATGLVACNQAEPEEDYVPEVVENEVEPEVEEDDAPEEVTEAEGHATSRGGIDNEADLIEALSADSANRAWVAGLAADLHIEGPLVIEGEAQRHSGGEFTTTEDGAPVFARKLGFYIRDEVNGVPRVPVGAYSLTVDEGIIVNSPQAFFISDGPFIANVYADVHVNVPYFRLSGVRIFGNVTFASQEYFDTAVWQAWDSEVAHIDEGTDADADVDFVLYRSNTGFQGHDNATALVSSSDATANVSNVDPGFLVAGNIYIEGTSEPVIANGGHATARGGITDAETLMAVLSATDEQRAWVAGLGDSIEMDGPLVIEGNVLRHSGGGFSGTYARKIGFYIREEVGGVPRIPVGAHHLTVREGIIVNSPNAFFISEGPFIAEVHGDVYVNIPYFRLSGVRIHGDVIFANEHYRDTAIAQVWDSEVANIASDHDGIYDDIVLYQGNSGFGVIDSVAGHLNESNVDFAELVTGEIRIAE